MLRATKRSTQHFDTDYGSRDILIEQDLWIVKHTSQIESISSVLFYENLNLLNTNIEMDPQR